MRRATSGLLAGDRLRLAARGGAAAVTAGVAVAVAGLAAAPSAAGDRSLTGRLTQTFLADSNLQLDDDDGLQDGEDSDDASLGSRSRLAFDYRDETRTSLFRFAGDIDYNAYTGSDNDDVAGLFPDVTATYTTAGTRSRIQLQLFGSAQPVDFLDLDGGLALDPDGEPTPIDPTDPDAGPPNVTSTSRDAIRVSYGASADYEVQVNSRDSTNVGFTVQRRDFIDGNRAQTPSNQFTTTTGWTRRISSRLTTGLSFNGSLLKAEGAQDTETVTMSLSPSIAYAVTPNQRWNLSLGPQYSITDRKEVQPGGGLAPETGYSFGLRAAAGFEYAVGVTRTSLSLNQSVSPNDDGDAVNRTAISGQLRQRISATTSLTSRLGAALETPLEDEETADSDETLSAELTTTLAREVNSFTSLDFSLGARYRDDGDDQDVVLSAGAGYGYALTRETGLRLAYDFRRPMGDISDEGDSHRLSLTLTHDFTLLP